MKNMYDGTITTDWHAGLGNGDSCRLGSRRSTGDFRYQLTVIGQFAQAIVASEISGTRRSAFPAPWCTSVDIKPKWRAAHAVVQPTISCSPGHWEGLRGRAVPASVEPGTAGQAPFDPGQVGRGRVIGGAQHHRVARLDISTSMSLLWARERTDWGPARCCVP